ncbi:ParA family protein [Rhodopila sp.]|uniref:ParA family protein n=1 Tax=Rhodopila sp. TaxID=2480087 RepID=UPI003D109813
MKTIGFFNNKGGVGKTTLVYHVAWMLAEMGVSVIAADFDPQANLTSAFLPEDRLDEIWNDPAALTVAGAVRPLIERAGDLVPPTVERVADDKIGVIIGDLALSRFEDVLSQVWPTCLSRDVGAFRVTSAFHRLVQLAGKETGADLALVDVGPNLGAINRAALIACDHVVIPLGADLFSLQGLRNVGPALREWQRDWADRLDRRPPTTIDLPTGSMTPAGYVIMRHSVRMNRPASAFGKWMARIPTVYAESVLAQPSLPWGGGIDPHCLALLKDFRSLMPLAQEARKPMFLLKPADGAFGGHQQAVLDCYRAFRDLTRCILWQCKIFPLLDWPSFNAGSVASR